MKREATADALGLHERASATPSPAARGPLAQLGCAPSWADGPLSLAVQQRWFAEIVSTPETEPAPVDPASAARLIAPSATQSSLERIEIYRRGYHARLIECLTDDYPVLQHALGEAPFDGLCRAYIARHPSNAPSLNYFGRHMAEFCSARASGEPSFAADLARLEWAIVLSIHAASPTSVGLEDLSRVPSHAWPGARFSVNPSLSILRLDYPANAYLQAYREGKSPLIPEPCPSVVAVYRTGRSVWRLELDCSLVTLVESLGAGATLEAALAEVQAALAGKPEAEAARLVSHCFQHSVSSGLFSRVLI